MGFFCPLKPEPVTSVQIEQALLELPGNLRNRPGNGVASPIFIPKSTVTLTSDKEADPARV
jgi:hypothetical protein